MQIRKRLRQTATLGVVGMIVLMATFSGFGPVDRASPVGESEAIVCGGVCIGVAAGGAALAGGAAVWMAADQGVIDPQDVDELEASEDAQQKVDLAYALTSEDATQDQFITEMNNTLENSRSIASIKAKAEIAEAINNGTTDVSEISTRVNNTIEDYYAVRQHNFKNRWDTFAYQVNYTVTAIDNDSGIALTDVFSMDGASLSNIVVDGVTVTLVNGTTVESRRISLRDGTGERNFTVARTENYGLELDAQTSTDGSIKNVSSRTLVSGSSSAYTEWEALWLEFESSVSNMKANYGPDFVEAVVAQYRAGDLNTSELISAETLANEWSTGYNQTGSSVYRWANYAAIGVDAPDLNGTAKMRVDTTRDPLARMIRFNVTSETWSDSYPVDLTLQYPDGNTTSYTLINESGVAQNPVVTIPTNSSSYKQRNIDVLLSWSEGGEILDFAPGTQETVNGGDLTLAQEGVDSVQAKEWGLLFSDVAPTNGWNVSEEYTLSNLDGSVYFSRSKSTVTALEEVRHAPDRFKEQVREKQPRVIDLADVADSFTITEATNDDGENITTVEVRDYNQQTTNVSKFVNETRRLVEVRKTIEKREPTVGGGGISIPGLPSGVPPWAPPAAAGGLGIVAILAAIRP